MATLAKFTTLITATPILLFAATQEASAALIRYDLSGVVTGSTGFTPSYVGLDWDYRAIIDTETQSVTEFEYTVDTRGTWRGTGGTALFDIVAGGAGGRFIIDVSTSDGATYTNIVDGFTPATFAGPDFELPIGLYGDFIDGFPTTIDVDQATTMVPVLELVSILNL